MFELSHRPMNKRMAKFGHLGLEDSSLGVINYQVDSSPAAKEKRRIKEAARQARKQKAIRKALREMEEANSKLALQRNLKHIS